MTAIQTVRRTPGFMVSVPLPQSVPSIQQYNVNSKTGTYVVVLSDRTILCDATGGAFTVTLPQCSSCTGQIFFLKKMDASGNAITIDGFGAETIDGAATQSLASQWVKMTVQSTGTEWVTL